MKKHEQKFLTEIKHSVEAMPNVWWFKIPDRPVFGDEPGKPRLPGSKPALRFMIQNPFDALLAVNGRTIAIEAKAHTNHNAWSLAEVKPHQVEALEKFAATGQPAIIIVNVRYGMGKQRVNFAAVMTVAKYKAMQSIRKSIPVAELGTDFQTMRWEGGRWTVEKIAEQIQGIFGEQKHG